MPRILVAALALLSGISTIAGLPDNAAAQKRVALVIGNSAYQHTAKLTNPKNDASDMAAALKKHGFQVIEGFDLDKAAFDRKVRDFSAALKGSEAGLFFYAGHGLQVGGQNYLVPVDAKAETEDALDWEMLKVEVVHRAMERATSTNILFLDACRDNPLARNLARSMGTRSSFVRRGLATVESGVGTLISFSTQPGNLALDGSGRNSPYASALVRQVSSSTEDLGSILIAVRNDVMKQTQQKQVPWEHSALTGRFYFATRSASVPTTKQEMAPKDTITMLEPEYKGTVQGGARYEVIAQRGRQSEPGLVKVENVKARYEKKDALVNFVARQAEIGDTTVAFTNGATLIWSDGALARLGSGVLHIGAGVLLIDNLFSLERDGSTEVLPCERHDDPRMVDLVFMHVKECEVTSPFYQNRLAARSYSVRFGPEPTAGEARALGEHLANLHADMLGALSPPRPVSDASEQKAQHYIEFGPLFSYSEGQEICDKIKRRCTISSPKP